MDEITTSTEVEPIAITPNAGMRSIGIHKPVALIGTGFPAIYHLQIILLDHLIKLLFRHNLWFRIQTKRK